MDNSHAPESFRGLLLRHRGRTGLIQRDLAARAGVSLRSVQDWEAGVKFPSAERLQALIGVLLAAGSLTTGRETAEARELWTAAERAAPRMHTPFDEEWFAGLFTAQASPPPAPPGPGTVERAQDWGEAPDTMGFVGRADELALLRGWVVEERCRLVTVLGFGGIGKTSLAARLAQTVAPSFECVYWRSLRNAPPVSEWLAGAIGFLSHQQQVPPSSESERITALLQLLRARRCLLVLDNSETLFEPGQREDRYRAGMDGYGQLLHAVGDTSHQSCMVLTSREAPPELTVLGVGVRRLELHGLGCAEAQALLADKQLHGDTQAWVSLVERYGGNGLALKIVGETIRQVYDGDVAEFVGQAVATSGIVFGGIRRLLDTQAERLSPVEHDVLTRLAVKREPISLAELATDMAPSVGRSTLVEAIETLRRRSLVERGERGATFTLQSMVLEYVTDRLVETVADEIGRGQPVALVEQLLIKAQAKDYVRQAQERLIGAPILQRLNAQHPEAGDPQGGATEARLLTLLDEWRGRPVAEQGYGPGNVVNLLRLLRGDLRGTNLSRLDLRQVYLQGVDAQDTSLAGAHLAGAVLDEAFAYPSAVALSADGAFLAAGTPMGEVRLWRATDRMPLLTVLGHTGVVTGVALSADGLLMASGSWDGTVRLWETGSGQLLATLKGHTGTVYGVALSADGRLVASGGVDGTVRLWESGGQLLATLLGHTGIVFAVALSANGRLVASGTADGTVRLWEARSGQLLATLPGHTGMVWCVALSADGRLVASGGVDGTVRLWETHAPQTPRVEVGGAQLLAALQGHAGGVRGVALSGDGRLVASGGVDGTVRLWETHAPQAPRSGAGGAQLLATLKGHTGVVLSVALSGDGRLMASGSWDGTVRLWETGGGQLLATLQGHTAVVWCVALSADRRLVASGGLDGMVRLWEAQTGQLLATLRGHTGVVYTVALSADGRLVASGGVDGTVRLWEAESGQLLARLQGHTGAVRGVAFSWDGKLVASGGADGTVRLWEAESGQLMVTLHGHTHAGAGQADAIWSVALSADGRRLASGSWDGTVRLWETGTQVPVRSTGHGGQVLTLQGHTGGARGVALSGDGRLVAGGSWGGTVRLWEAPSGQLLAALQGHTGVVLSVALSADGRLAASGGEDGTVGLWETASGELLATLPGHTGVVLSVALSADGRLVASGGVDGTVRLWEAISGASLRTLRSDRHYQRLDITGLSGVTEAQRAALLALGAIEQAPAPSGPTARAG